MNYIVTEKLNKFKKKLLNSFTIYIFNNNIFSVREH